MPDANATLKLGNEEKSFPVLSGSVGPDVMDFR